MIVLTRCKPSEYHDSVTLMLVAKAMLEMPGVQDAALVMGTPGNHEILAASGMLTPEAAAGRADDLVLVVKAETNGAAEAAMAEAERRLAAPAARSGSGPARRPRSVASAAAALPGANLAVISVAGRYAAAEARQALLAGLHVLLFSDNVALEDEIALKQLAEERGLLLMGPDAGTAIINGVALGFANAVPRGRVGVVSAAGTGLQAVTCGVARAGAGISQGIGTGGRDLQERVGGIMMLQGLRALQEDPGTGVVLLVSKPPASAVARRVLEQISCSPKPTVVCFLGADPGAVQASGALPATTLAQAAAAAAALARGDDPAAALAALEQAGKALIPKAAEEQARLAPGQCALRGLFAGGTFCYEAQLILKSLPEPVYSNAPLAPAYSLAAAQPDSHYCIDMGEDEFTQGRLHPMMDPSLRNRRIVQEAANAATAVILLDVVLGYGAHPDPAGATVPAIREAQEIAAQGGRHLVFVAHVCGTEEDPQHLSAQEAQLRAAGVILQPDNASAARLAGLITQANR